MPDADWWDGGEVRELAAPWIDPEWNTARSALFLAALQLHKSFLEHAAGQMRSNLFAAIDVLKGEAPGEVTRASVREAWRSLFFVVPVVSTTFVVRPDVLAPRSRRPRMALHRRSGPVGSPERRRRIWRSRRVVVVGDPLQLEPVVTLSNRSQAAMARTKGVAERWAPGRNSVQQLADQLTPLGTWLKADEESIWVGAPLRVHRRCDHPMFTAVNDMAYDGLMVDGLVGVERPDPGLPHSKWIDVASPEASGHWVPAEGQKVVQILDHLTTEGFDLAEVFVITPFREVARELRKLIDRFPGLTTGTVHTAQGKEADVVILVLGGDPARPGARDWVVTGPNLINVAVSRAKRRLYVIGDYQDWRRRRYLSTLASLMPPRSSNRAAGTDPAVQAAVAPVPAPLTQ